MTTEKSPFYIPLSLRHDLVIAGKKRLCFYNIMDLKPEMLEMFLIKIISFYFNLKKNAADPDTEIGKNIPPDIILEDYLCCSDGREFYFSAEMYDPPEILKDFHANQIPFHKLAERTIRKIQENMLLYKNTMLESAEISVVIAFTDKEGIDVLKKIEFPDNLIFFAFICGEKEKDVSYPQNFYSITSPENIEGTEKNFFDLLRRTIDKTHKIPNFANGKLYFADNNPIRIAERIGEGSEGAIFKTSMSHFLAKIYYDPSKNEHMIKNMIDNTIPLYGVSLPEEMLYNENGVFQGFLMKNARGVTLNDLVYRPDYFYPEGDVPRQEIILKLLKNLSDLNKRNFFLDEISLENFIVDVKNPYLDIIFIDAERFSNNHEIMQNMALPEFIFHLLSSGLSQEQFFSHLGQKFCDEILPPLLIAAFHYSFSPNKSARHKWLSPEEWLKLMQ